MIDLKYNNLKTTIDLFDLRDSWKSTLQMKRGKTFKDTFYEDFKNLKQHFSYGFDPFGKEILTYRLYCSEGLYKYIIEYQKESQRYSIEKIFLPVQQLDIEIFFNIRGISSIPKIGYMTNYQFERNFLYCKIYGIYYKLSFERLMNRISQYKNDDEVFHEGRISFSIDKIFENILLIHNYQTQTRWGRSQSITTKWAIFWSEGKIQFVNKTSESINDR